MVRVARKPNSVPSQGISTERRRQSFLYGCRLPGTSCNLPGSSDGPSSITPLFGLAPGGVYQASPVARRTGALLPHRFTLTLPRAAADVRQCRPRPRTAGNGGLLSVALSFASPRLHVMEHPALWCSDFPPDTLCPAIAQATPTISQKP